MIDFLLPVMAALLSADAPSLCPASHATVSEIPGYFTASPLDKNGLPKNDQTISVQLSPNDARLKALRPLISAVKSKRKGAIRSIADKLMAHQKDPSTIAVARYMLVKYGKLKESRRVKQWTELVDNPCFGVEAAWQLALTADKRGDSKAIALYARIPGWDRRYSRALLRRAQLMANAGQIKGAMAVLMNVAPSRLGKDTRKQFWPLVESLARRSRQKTLQIYALRKQWQSGINRALAARKLKRLKAPITWGDHVGRTLNKLNTSMGSVTKVLKLSKKLARKVPGMLAYIKGVAISKLWKKRASSVSYLKRATWHLKHRRDRANAHYHLGHILGRLGREKEALPHLLKVATLAPNTSIHEKTLWRLFRMYNFLHRRTDAQRTLNDLIKRFPWSQYQSRALWSLGWMAYEDKRYNDAYKQLLQLAQKFGHEYGGGRQPRVAQAMYWIAKIEQKLGRKARANQLWDHIVRTWPMSHYAHLSRGQLRYEFPQPPTTIPKANESPSLFQGLMVEQHPALLYPTLLTRLGLYGQAEDHLVDQLNGHLPAGGGDLLVALSAHNQHHKRIRYLVRYRMCHIQAPNSRNHWAWRKYLNAPYPDEFRAGSKASSTPQALLYAIGFHESRFRARVYSVANAMGILQVVPGVERRVAKAMGWEAQGRKMLMEPAYNIKIAAHFLSGLLASVENNYLLLTAAYASGGHTLKRWLKRYKTREIDHFVESMPFASTRSYTKGVGVFTVAFSRIYSEWNEGSKGLWAYTTPVLSKIKPFVIHASKNRKDSKK